MRAVIHVTTTGAASIDEAILFERRIASCHTTMSTPIDRELYQRDLSRTSMSHRPTTYDIGVNRPADIIRNHCSMSQEIIIAHVKGRPDEGLGSTGRCTMHLANNIRCNQHLMLHPTNAQLEQKRRGETIDWLWNNPVAAAQSPAYEYLSTRPVMSARPAVQICPLDE